MQINDARLAARRRWFDPEPSPPLRRWLTRLLALIYPLRCVATGEPLPIDARAPFSEAGFESLPWIGDGCPRCGAPLAPGLAPRSEERRVGKACRSRGAPYH